jgi:GTPase SAR1 family protein
MNLFIYLEVEKNASQTAIKMLVGNKLDLAEKRVISTREGTELAERLGAVAYMETSAKTGANVEKAFITLA